MKKTGSNNYFWLSVSILLFCSTFNLSSGQEFRIPKMTISTGSVGGGWYATCSSIAEWTNARAVGYPITAVPGSGGVGNPIRVAKGDADIGASFSLFLILAEEGKPPYQEKHSNLRSICSLTSNVNHFLVAENINAVSIDNIANKRIGLRLASGFPGEANYAVLDLIFTELGISEKNIKEWGGSILRIGTSGRLDLWRDRHINAFQSISELYASEITEAMATRKGRLLGLSEPLRDILIQKYKFRKIDIPPGTYPGQDYPVPSVQSAMVLFTTQEANEEAIYLITKTIAESEGLFKKSYGIFRNWKSENMIQDLGIRIHDGALKYYKEKGWL